MKVKGDLKEYSIIGRKLPSAMEPNPKLFRQQIFAPDSVAAKSRFWKFLSYYQKINKKVGEIVECSEIHESHPGCVKNYGIWIRYDSRSTSENMYREYSVTKLELSKKNGIISRVFNLFFEFCLYRDVSLPLAVTQMYREMAARHRARPGSIQVLRTKQIKSNECRRPQNKQMHDPNIKFPLPRRVMSKAAQHARRFSTKRPNTIY